MADDWAARMEGKTLLETETIVHTMFSTSLAFIEAYIIVGIIRAKTH